MGRERDRVRWILYPLLAIVVAGGLVAARLKSSSSHAEGAADSVRTEGRLAGVTEEKLAVSVRLDREGRAQKLATRIVGLCDDGTYWTINWSPDSPRIPFRTDRHGFSVRESKGGTDARGTRREVVAWTTGRVARDRSSAEGDARFAATFHEQDGERLRCDSGYVHWSASGSSRTADTLPAPQRFTYGAVPSLAADASAARRRFAARADRTCVRKAAEIHKAEAAVERRYAERSDVRWRVGAAYIAAHQREYEALRALGRPPEAARLYEAAVANMGQRIELERRELAESMRGETTSAAATYAKINFLKVQGNAVGQEFGLRLCTSNGALRVPTGRGAARRGSTL